MVPLHLRISGFLSYRDSVELDFDSFELACISGQNGAGKSSLLDAMTWSLFGEARGKSSDVINLHADVKAAEVVFTFEHEQNTYRVQRSLPRGKSTILEFQVLDHRPQTADSNTQRSAVSGQGVWRPLTEKTTRDTQTRIEQTLRLDYETFVNASFFLQGKADQFTQQNASRRKDVLSNILGLEIWEEYKTRTADKRKFIESRVEEIEGRIAEIDAELAEEQARTSRLEELQRSLKQLSTAREAQESILENLKKNAALLNEQRKLTSALAAGLERSRTALAAMEARLADKQAERASFADLINRAQEIEGAYKTWQTIRRELEDWEKTAAEFLEYQKDRAPLQEAIAVEKAKLEEERRALLAEQEELGQQRLETGDLGSAIANARTSLKVVEAKIEERAIVEVQRNSTRESQVELKAENDALKIQMDELKTRIDTLKSADGAKCPLCGQDLTKAHRASTLEQLQIEGKEMGDRHRANKAKVAELIEHTKSLESQISSLSSVENDRVKYASEISQLTERMDTLEALAKDWESTGKKRLKEVEKILESGKYAVDEQKRLAKLDKELAKLGYDTAAHDEARENERKLRDIENEYRQLESAKTVSKQIESEILNLEEESGKRKAEVETQQKEFDDAAAALKEVERHSPNLDDAERELFRLREEENHARGELGGAQQRVDILVTQRARKADFEKDRDTLRKQIAQHRALEQAFGKNGVPALLIEQALPQIEDKANELLDRLSDGQMSMRFVTQEKYKDEKRNDLKETLGIEISDTAGTRNYEMYSGGEAFRVNFAIRLALSEILAQRKGARLQTLVIDEGFGSQDAQGRQRLIEAINLVKKDFAKILVITHLDELKDAFPARIEVEKSERGSVVRVL
jgi:exonuclease SbcC